LTIVIFFQLGWTANHIGFNQWTSLWLTAGMGWLETADRCNCWGCPKERGGAPIRMIWVKSWALPMTSQWPTSVISISCWSSIC
jgi:hypothetical protein